MSPGSPVSGGKDTSLPSEPTLEGAELPGLCPDTQDTRADQRQPLHPPALLAGRGGAGREAGEELQPRPLRHSHAPALRSPGLKQTALGT